MIARRPRHAGGEIVTRRFNVFGYTFGFAALSAPAHQLLYRLYGSFVADEADVTDTFDLEASRAGHAHVWTVSLGSQVVIQRPSLGSALSYFEYEVCQRVIAQSSDWIVLHGATLSTPQGAAFISGASGAGKTTLALALGARGYRVGGDDLALLGTQTGEVRPMPRCFHLDQRSRRLLRATGLRIPAQAARHQFVTPTDLDPSTAPLPPIRLIVLLSSGQGREPQLIPLTQAETVVRLRTEIRWGQYPALDLLSALSRLTSGTTCYQLTRGELRRTADLVGSLLGPSPVRSA
jgi:hypothetical protein